MGFPLLWKHDFAIREKVQSLMIIYCRVGVGGFRQSEDRRQIDEIFNQHFCRKK